MSEEQAAWRRLAAICSEADFSLDDRIVDGMQPALRLLARFNAKTNLVGDASVDAVLSEHVLESLALVTALRRAGLRPRRAVDVGAGAGLESLVLALSFGECEVTAMEPRRKRADFIELAADRAGVGRRVRVLRRSLGREQSGELFDLATSRATFAPQRWMELAAALCAAGGHICAHLGAAGSALAAEPVSAVPVPGRARLVAVYAAGRAAP